MTPARLLILAGAALLDLGLALLAAERLGLGRLPGDLVLPGRHTTAHFPIVTSVLLSLLRTLVAWLVGRWR